MATRYVDPLYTTSQHRHFAILMLGILGLVSALLAYWWAFD
jgi:hypothetical protein